MNTVYCIQLTMSTARHTTHNLGGIIFKCCFRAGHLFTKVREGLTGKAHRSNVKLCAPPSPQKHFKNNNDRCINQ